MNNTATPCRSRLNRRIPLKIEQLCDKLVLLNEGNLIYQGTVQGILEEGQSLERFYLDFLNQAGKTC